MVQIVNSFLTNIYDFLLKRQESKLVYKKEFLNIKLEEFNEKRNKLINNHELKYKHKLSFYETKAGIESIYIKELIQEKTQELENKHYWQNRVLKQKLTRAKNDEAKKAINEKIELLDKDLKEKKEIIKTKYLNPNPTKEEISLYEDNKEVFDKNKSDKLNALNQKYDQKIKKLEVKTEKLVEKYNQQIKDYSNSLIKLENGLNESKKSLVLDKSLALSIKNLSMHFGGLKAVDDLSFDVKKGEIFGLIGPNGAGKTTVFNCITRFYKPTDGDMYFNNANQKTVHLNKIKVHNVIKEGIARTFQNVELVWELNILDNLLVAAHSAYRSNFFHHMVHSHLTKREEIIFTKKALKILEDLELTPYTFAYPIGLPYGVLKKVELARTLMTNPKMIILDEPAAGLNDTETKELAAFIKKIKEEYDITIFLVEHDMGLVMSICDTICAISFGKKLAIGTPKEIQKSKVVQEAYLGGE